MKTGKQERKKCQAVAQIEALLVRCRSTERSITADTLQWLKRAFWPISRGLHLHHGLK
jgi:hypothetical protein